MSDISVEGCADGNDTVLDFSDGVNIGFVC